jgi:hypothetical protein
MFRRSCTSLVAAKVVASEFSAQPLAEGVVSKSIPIVIAEHNASGDDVTENLTKEFIANNFATMSYRIVKLNEEWRYVKENPASVWGGASTFIGHSMLMVVIYCVVYQYYVKFEDMTILPPVTEEKKSE